MTSGTDIENPLVPCLYFVFALGVYSLVGYLVIRTAVTNGILTAWKIRAGAEVQQRREQAPKQPQTSAAPKQA